MRPTRVTTTAVVSLTALSFAFVAAGCGSEAGPASIAPTQDPTVSSETAAAPEESSADPKQAAIDERTADAIARYEEFTEIYNSKLQEGESPYSALGPTGFLASNEMRNGVKGFGAETVDRGYKQTGSIVIDDITFVEYKGDPLAEDFAGHEIHFTSCSDLTQVDYIDEDGASHFAEEQRQRLVADVKMRGVDITVDGQSKTVWGLSQQDPTGEEC